MRNCLNCKGINKDTDKYCRNCGVKLHNNIYYVLINITTFLIVLGIIIMILLFIASFLV